MNKNEGIKSTRFTVKRILMAAFIAILARRKYFLIEHAFNFQPIGNIWEKNWFQEVSSFTYQVYRKKTSIKIFN